MESGITAVNDSTSSWMLLLLLLLTDRKMKKKKRKRKKENKKSKLGFSYTRRLDSLLIGIPMAFVS